MNSWWDGAVGLGVSGDFKRLLCDLPTRALRARALYTSRRSDSHNANCCLLVEYPAVDDRDARISSTSGFQRGESARKTTISHTARMTLGASP